MSTRAEIERDSIAINEHGVMGVVRGGFEAGTGHTRWTGIPLEPPYVEWRAGPRPRVIGHVRDLRQAFEADAKLTKVFWALNTNWDQFFKDVKRVRALIRMGHRSLIAALIDAAIGHGALVRDQASDQSEDLEFLLDQVREWFRGLEKEQPMVEDGDEYRIEIGGAVGAHDDDGTPFYSFNIRVSKQRNR